MIDYEERAGAEAELITVSCLAAEVALRSASRSQQFNLSVSGQPRQSNNQQIKPSAIDSDSNRNIRLEFESLQANPEPLVHR